MSKGMSKWLLWTALGLLLMAIAVGILWHVQKYQQEAVQQGIETVYTSEDSGDAAPGLLFDTYNENEKIITAESGGIKS